MARYNEILAGRFNRALTKIFSMKGEAPSPQMASEVAPGFITENLFDAELRSLAGWNRFGWGGTVAAAAGFKSTVMFRNPAGSNVVIVFEKFQVGEGSNDTTPTTHGPQITDLATINSISTARLDPRGIPQPTLVISQTNASTPAALAQVLFNTPVLAGIAYDQIVYDHQEIPLLPGEAVQMQAGGVNIALFSTVMWRERFMEESERSF